jgi:hypothetical protein
MSAPDPFFSEERRAIREGIFLGRLCILPFLVFCKLVGMLFDVVGAVIRARQERNAFPPESEPPPDFQYYNSPPPPPPPATPPASSDPLEKFRVILGVPKDANKEQIQKRYRVLSQFYHPDKVSENLKAEADEEFKRIGEAYRVLSATAPEVPTVSKAQERKTEAPKPKPNPPAPKRDPVPPRQSKAEAKSPATNTGDPSKNPTGNSQRPDLKLRPEFNRPKYF